ncbi:AcrR Transcriptional regulator [Comamonadaceae bacterium]
MKLSACTERIFITYQTILNWFDATKLPKRPLRTQYCSFLFKVVTPTSVFVKMNERSLKIFFMTIRSRAEAKAARREQLVEAALHCFETSGFHQTSMRDIAAQADASLGNLYNHFQSKSALIAEIAQMEAAELFPLEEQLGKQCNRSGLLRFASGYTALHQDATRLMLGAEILSELIRHPELAAPFLATRHRLVTALTSAIEQARTANDLAMGIAARDLAGLLLDAIEGRCFLDALAKNQTPVIQFGMPLSNLIEALLAPTNTGHPLKYA